MSGVGQNMITRYLNSPLLQPSGGRAQDLHEGQVEGDGELGRVQCDGERRDGQVRDEDKEKITFKISSPSVKPKNWKMVKKRGIIPDGLVQSKLKSFITKFPNLERGVKRNIHESSPVSREGGCRLVFRMVFRMNNRRRTLIQKVKTEILYKFCHQNFV